MISMRITTIRKKRPSHRQGTSILSKSSETISRKEEEEYLASRDENGGGTAWERISKYVDISEKSTAGSGPARYRELLLSLKSDSNAPGSEA
jgi:Clathrin light chain